MAVATRLRRRSPAAKPRSHSEKWSVSRTSNFLRVSLLFSIFPAASRSLFEVGVVSENAKGSRGILFPRGGTCALYEGSHFPLQSRHAFFQCLRHGDNMTLLPKIFQDIPAGGGRAPARAVSAAFAHLKAEARRLKAAVQLAADAAWRR